eukprot:4573538-Pleurochrysis_carterae.AAC.1
MVSMQSGRLKLRFVDGIEDGAGVLVRALDAQHKRHVPAAAAAAAALTWADAHTYSHLARLEKPIDQCAPLLEFRQFRVVDAPDVLRFDTWVVCLQVEREVFDRRLGARQVWVLRPGGADLKPKDKGGKSGCAGTKRGCGFPAASLKGGTGSAPALALD